MMSKLVLKFAASGLVLAATMVACSPGVHGSRAAAVGTNAVKADAEAARLYAAAQEKVAKGDVAGALGLAEQAVSFAPADVGYRMLLADLYLKSGRFQSAHTTFGDVLQLEPGNSRAALSQALAQVGMGDAQGALAQLDALGPEVSPADLGLAYALAGQPNRAIALLEPAARAVGADGRTRQNLALAYAFAGDWPKARVTAAQDVSPADLSKRLQQWASMAKPDQPAEQVAGLFGVRPVADPGQPAQLALAQPEPEASAFAEAEAAPAPQAAPVQVAANVQAAPPAVAAPAAPVEIAKIEWPLPKPAAEAASLKAEPDFAPAVRALVEAQPAVGITASPAAKPVPATFASAKPATLRRAVAEAPAKAKAGGRFVVQIGAYSSSASVERAWASASRRYGLADHAPTSTTVSIAGRGTFHRLSVSGFDSHGDASQTCATIRAKGGRCFVRAVAGDKPVQWASRTSRKA